MASSCSKICEILQNFRNIFWPKKVEFSGCMQSIGLKRAEMQKNDKNFGVGGVTPPTENFAPFRGTPPWILILFHVWEHRCCGYEIVYYVNLCNGNAGLIKKNTCNNKHMGVLEPNSMSSWPMECPPSLASTSHSSGVCGS